MYSHRFRTNIQWFGVCEFFAFHHKFVLYFLDYSCWDGWLIQKKYDTTLTKIQKSWTKYTKWKKKKKFTRMKNLNKFLYLSFSIKSFSHIIPSHTNFFFFSLFWIWRSTDLESEVRQPQQTSALNGYESRKSTGTEKSVPDLLWGSLWIPHQWFDPFIKCKIVF